MANTDFFKKSGSEFQGEIVTLNVQTKNVRSVPETNRANDNAPSHRVYVGRAKIGAAWSNRSNEGRDYLSVKLFDASLHEAFLPAPDRSLGHSCRTHDLIGAATRRSRQHNPGTPDVLLRAVPTRHHRLQTSMVGSANPDFSHWLGAPGL